MQESGRGGGGGGGEEDGRGKEEGTRRGGGGDEEGGGGDEEGTRTRRETREFVIHYESCSWNSFHEEFVSLCYSTPTDHHGRFSYRRIYLYSGPVVVHLDPLDAHRAF